MALDYIKYSVISTLVNASLVVRRSRLLSPDSQPTRTKKYRFHLFRTELYPARIFEPNDSPPKATDQLPLVILVHGGGFIVNNPSLDDPLARQLSNAANSVVVSVDYRKAPFNKFPAAYEDIVEHVLEIVRDSELPIDHDRVVLAGSSAGGCLVLAAAQDPRIRHLLSGVLALYPVCDFRPSAEEKMATRPDPSVPDFLGKGAQSMVSTYLTREDLQRVATDARISPILFKQREDLPPNVLMIGAEHDMLCREAEDMVKKLGSGAKGARFHRVLGQKHAFDVFPARGDEEKKRIVARDETWDVMSKWLVEVFSSKK